MKGCGMEENSILIWKKHSSKEKSQFYLLLTEVKQTFFFSPKGSLIASFWMLAITVAGALISPLNYNYR